MNQKIVSFLFALGLANGLATNPTQSIGRMEVLFLRPYFFVVLVGMAVFLGCCLTFNKSLERIKKAVYSCQLV